MRRTTTRTSSGSSLDGSKHLDDDAFTRRTAEASRANRPPQKNRFTRAIKGFFLMLSLLILLDGIYLYNLSSKALESTKTVGSLTALVRQTNHTRIAKVVATHEEPEDQSSYILDKGPILKILSKAGIEIEDLDAETLKALPTWSRIQSLFGDRPRIFGLETCQAFRESVDPTVKFFGIAGTFNTGTNLLSELMIQNCQITERMKVYGNESKGMRWQVPWGKHYPATERGSHVTGTDRVVPHENSLPLITIRDPYQWMQSMCRHTYGANWRFSKKHCPNLVPTVDDKLRFKDLAEKETVPVTIVYSIKKNFHVAHDSLVHLWNEWYNLYFIATFPRIIVRFEDLLFYGEEVTETLCECGGGVPREDRKFPHFVYVSESAKLGTAAHGNHKTGLLDALIKYGSDDHRLDQMTPEDLALAAKILDPKMMEYFGYTNPST
jgi:hypothetical protein